jgi:hypothetical protein
MLMQEKETKYKGGIMAFVPSRFPFWPVSLTLWPEVTKWGSVRIRVFLSGEHAASPNDGGRRMVQARRFR